ncbi:hypothetical protein Osc7112_2201 [Oscillatoria nigro-viridis PCC 7112]|uniref:Uncharacterized protein n=1 Tax=Phormidium nigroviride PCC 7112 TaxID=179408 RepID=K9VEY8_9CYAN|nr:hypothetical protein [Oscillatoria nigro-viridis]AFZ06663.1 hypothetical protein Osc7112_2201 [Oscillatoria nigro-viridis PCC 7112]
MKTLAKFFNLPINILTIGLSASLIFPASVKALSNLITTPTISEISTVLAAVQKEQTEFLEGVRSAEVKKERVVPGTFNSYFVAVKKGQNIKVNVKSLENNAVFKVIDSNKKTIITNSKIWSGVVSKTGKYQIDVGTERGSASYTLSFSLN